MDELVNRVAGATGMDAETARKAIALILGFLAKEGPEEDVAALSQAIPDAEAAIAEVEEKEDSFIFLSRDFFEAEKAVVIIHGTGVVRAGQWSRR